MTTRAFIAAVEHYPHTKSTSRQLPGTIEAADANATPHQWDVFISHSGHARPWVTDFAEELRSCDLKVFVDKDSIEPGSNLVSSLSDGLSQSHDLVLAVNEDSASSYWVAMETAVGLYSQAKSDRRIIPVFLDDTPPEAINIFITTLASIDQSDPATRVAERLRLRSYLEERKQSRTPGPTGTSHLHPVVMHSSANPDQIDQQFFVRQIQQLRPDCTIIVINILAAGSSELHLIADCETATFLRQKKNSEIGGIRVDDVNVLERFTSTELVGRTQTASRSRTISVPLARYRLRADQAFCQERPSQLFERQRAIIGSRTDQLAVDAEVARSLLLQNKEPSPKQLAALEQAIRFQRPAPTCKPDEATRLPHSSNPFNEEWTGFQETLKRAQGSVARLDRIDDPDASDGTLYTPLGTAFFVGDGLLMTAAHVVDELSFGSGVLERGQAIAEFCGYYNAPGRERTDILEVVAVDSESDLAILRFDTAGSIGQRVPLRPANTELAFGTPICVVGYPLEDLRNRNNFVAIIFGDRYAVKRAAIGAVIDVNDEVFFHDCSTLGGNSGSPVFDLVSGRVGGVHVNGRALARNAAVTGRAASRFLKSHSSSLTTHVFNHSNGSNQMNFQRRSFDLYMKQLRESDPEIEDEIQETMQERARTESADRLAMEFMPETVVLTTGRPVLDVKKGATVLDIDEVESLVWKDRLAKANHRLAANIPAVGRIELANHPSRVDWLGTGWLIRGDIVVTNRHVARIFGERNGVGFRFQPGLDGNPMRANIDFLEEFDSEDGHEFPLFRIMHIEDGGGPDLAFLRIEPIRDQKLPDPVPLSSKAAKVGDQVVVIGYPARDDFFPNPAVMDRIFNHRYDKKRVAPGLVIGTNASRLFHDCSTLGGNSGGEIVSLATGKAVALHFAGTLFQRNHAVPVADVVSRLEDVLAGRTGETTTSIGTDTTSRPQDPSPPATSSVSSRVIDATIPIRVHIELGDIDGSQPAMISVAPTSTDGADNDLIEVTEARPSDYRDRDGYEPAFLGDDFVVPLPVLTHNQSDTLTYEFDGETHEVLRYRHFSVLMSESRRMCRYSACNIDGNSTKKKGRKGWRFDPRIPRDLQIMRECYGNPPKFSRGHMTRRNDPVWGSSSRAQQGNTDSMHVSNAVPQIQPFNAGIWLDLEDYALENAKDDDMRISVFTGPFLSRNDPRRFGVKIPITFWKIIAFIHDGTGKLTATGYTMSQRSFIGEEEFIFGEHENNQRPIAEIERRAGISFDRLADVDPLRDAPESAPSRLTDPSQIKWV